MTHKPSFPLTPTLPFALAAITLSACTPSAEETTSTTPAPTTTQQTTAPADPTTWPSFRGHFARGIADGQNLPTSWDVTSGTNVRWEREIPGTSHSSPIISGGKLFLVTAVSEESQGNRTPFALSDGDVVNPKADLEQTFSWQLHSFDAATGEPLWQREAYAGAPRTARHPKASQANATPSSNGETVVAIFGSQGMSAFDHAGNLLWNVDLGVLDPGLFGDADSHWGHASSPTIHQDKVFVQVDRHANSFIAAYSLASGEEVWKVERQEKPIWATPTIHKINGTTQLIVVGGDFDRGLDPNTGEELWRFARDFQVKTPTPFVANGKVILAGGYKGKELFAVQANATGLVEGDELAWTSDNGGPYTSTPVAYGNHLFFVRDTGIFNVLDVDTGKRLHRERTDSGFSASPVASDGKIYFAGEDGMVSVRSAEAPFAVIAANDMDEPCMSTPAIANETLYVRCRTKLWAIGNVGVGSAG